jgi:hypothetical protein
MVKSLHILLVLSIVLFILHCICKNTNVKCTPTSARHGQSAGPPTARSKLILVNIQFGNILNGVAITQIHLHNLTINSVGYYTDITIDSVTVEKFTVHFTYSDEIRALDNTLENSRVQRENAKPFSYVNELKHTQGDNPLLNRNLHWAYNVTGSEEQIDEANINIEGEGVDHQNVTYAQLKDNYGEGNIHIFLEN